MTDLACYKPKIQTTEFGLVKVVNNDILLLVNEERDSSRVDNNSK